MNRKMLKLTAEEVHANIPYSLICMTRYGSSWDTGRCRRAWLLDFTEGERNSARRLFRISHNWTVGKGVPATVHMSLETFYLWQKLGEFCASV